MLMGSSAQMIGGKKKKSESGGFGQYINQIEKEQKIHAASHQDEDLSLEKGDFRFPEPDDDD